MKPFDVNINFLYPLETLKKKHRFFMFPGVTKANIDPKWVKQQQYRHNLMLLTRNACSSIVKQNHCKNKNT